MKNKVITYKGKDLYLFATTYACNDRLCLGLVDKNDELYCILTINLTEKPLYENEIFINGDVSDELLEKLQENNVFGEITDYCKYNMGTYRAVSVDYDVLRKYDEKGIDKYFSNYIDDMER